MILNCLVQKIKPFSKFFDCSGALKLLSWLLSFLLLFVWQILPNHNILVCMSLLLFQKMYSLVCLCQAIIEVHLDCLQL